MDNPFMRPGDFLSPATNGSPHAESHWYTTFDGYRGEDLVMYRQDVCLSLVYSRTSHRFRRKLTVSYDWQPKDEPRTGYWRRVASFNTPSGMETQSHDFGWDDCPGKRISKLRAQQAFSNLLVLARRECNTGIFDDMLSLPKKPLPSITIEMQANNCFVIGLVVGG